MSASQLECAVRGCTYPCKQRKIMCARHWAAVPRQMQQALWRTRAWGESRKCHPSERYQLAVADAVRAAIQETAA